MPRLRGLLLDVGGTLVPNAFAVSDHTYARLKTERLRKEFGAELPWFQPLVDHRFSSDAIGPDLRQDVEGEVVQFLGNLGAAVTSGEVARICRACSVPLTQLVALASGAEAAIRDARGMGLRLGICSNTFWRDDALVREDWRAFGLADSIAAYITSRSTGYAKPHPAIFARALAKIAVQPAEAAILGDRLDRDIAGGAAFGMRTIWLRSADAPAGNRAAIRPFPECSRPGASAPGCA